MEHVVEVLRRHGLDRAELADAGVEEGAVDPADVFADFGAERLRVREGSGVGSQHDGLRAEGGLGGREGRGIAARDDDPGAFGFQELGGGKTDTGRASGNEDGLIFHGWEKREAKGRTETAS